ncbi:MAG: permease [Synergistetes bacterium]|nr:MAG: Uncharacterized protein XD52_0477 [bacterium 42_11]MBC7330839.1 permease [Synergistota bacterium]
MIDLLKGEFIYLWFYFTLLFNQIFPYWIFGVLVGSFLSSLGEGRFHKLFLKFQVEGLGAFGIVLASLLGIASPLSMYGTVPIIAVLLREGLRQDWIAAFITSSILLNPQLLVYSALLGKAVLIIRFVSCFLCGVMAGLCVRYLYKDRSFFNFSCLAERVEEGVRGFSFKRFLQSLFRNFKVTGLHLLIGIALTVFFQRYIPQDVFLSLFGSHRGFGILMSAGLGVPLYICGGGTIPLLMDWLERGMSVGEAVAFMIVGPATKFTNLGALKMILPVKHIVIYLVYFIFFAFLFGFVLNFFLGGM